MPVLKGVKVDDIDNVTVAVVKDLAARERYFPDGRIHVAISEAATTAQDVMVETSPGKSICHSTRTSHIDFLVDFPDEKALDWVINYLQEVKEGIPRQQPTNINPPQ